MIPALLANTTEPDALISGAWLIAIVKVAIIALGPAGAAWIVALRKGERQGVEKERGKAVTLQDPVPELPVRRVYSPPSFSQHMNVVDRVVKLEKEADELRQAFHAESAAIRRDLSKQYVEILHAGHERENRLSDKLDDIARAFHSRVDDLLNNPPNKSGK